MRLLFLLLFAAGSACATLPKPKPATPIECKRYALVPPTHLDEKASRYIAALWIQSAKRDLRSCDRFVEQGKAINAFRLLNVEYHTRFRDRDFGPEQAEHLRRETGATHLVELSYKLSGGKLHAKARVRRLQPLSEERRSPLAATRHIDLTPNAPLRLSERKRLKVQGLRLLPNSVRGGLAGFNLVNERTRSGELAEKSHRELSILPPLISSFGVINVEHPWGFDTNELSFRPIFSLNTFYVHGRYVFEKDGDAASERSIYVIQYFVLAPEISGEVSLHWAGGTTYVSLGAGIGIYYLNDSYARRPGLALTSPLVFGHRVFVDERVYIEAYIYESLLKPAIDNADFKSFRRDGSFFGVGYFFPEVKTYLRREL